MCYCLVQVVSLCWTWNLYDAIIYIYNRGMADYVTPLQQLLAVLKTAVDSGVHLSEAQVDYTLSMSVEYIIIHFNGVVKSFRME